MKKAIGRKPGMRSEDIAKRNDAIFLMWAHGSALADIGAAFGLTAAMIGIIVRQRGGSGRRPMAEKVVIKVAPKEGKYEKRDAEMVGMYRMGHTLQEIGDSYGITREAVRLRLRRSGLDRMDGGAAARNLKRISERVAEKRAKEAEREQRIFEKWGMTPEALAALSPLNRSNPAHPVMRFQAQRNAARRRGIEWRLTFAEWWRIWQESGRWSERGPGKGYCMARWADNGPYSAENTYICTIGQNFSDGWLVRPRKSGARQRNLKPKTHWAVGDRYCVQLPGGRRTFVPDEATAKHTLAAHGVAL